jgi:hypothetical protein
MAYVVVIEDGNNAASKREAQMNIFYFVDVLALTLVLGAFVIGLLIEPIYREISKRGTLP